MPTPIRSTRLLVTASLAGALAAAAAAMPLGGDAATPPNAPMKEGGTTGGKDAKGGGAESSLYEHLDKEDRDALQANVGWMIPKPPESLKWVGGDAMKRDDFRGKVTVIQSVGGKSSPRAALEKARKSLPEGAVLIGLHTPEQAERADAALSNNPVCPVAIDSAGEWCDALGVWKKPVNIVVDKTGAVRFVGLNDAGLKAKLPQLLAEEVDESVEAKEKPAAPGTADTKPATADAKWPEFNAPVENAADMRGKKSPGLTVGKWVTSHPEAGNRLIAIDFWATWCGPCRAAIPHVNELNQKYGRDILFVGMSDEKEQAFNAGLKKQKLQLSTFTYSLALDPAAALKDKFFQIKGIPHMAILSPDGVVRWQGHPMTLQTEDLDKLVAANKANTKTAAAGGAKGGRGWAASGAGQKSR